MNPYSKDTTMCKGYKACELCVTCNRNMNGKKTESKDVFLLPPFKNKKYCIAYKVSK